MKTKTILLIGGGIIAAYFAYKYFTRPQAGAGKVIVDNPTSPAANVAQAINSNLSGITSVANNLGNILHSGLGMVNN